MTAARAPASRAATAEGSLRAALEPGPGGGAWLSPALGAATLDDAVPAESEGPPSAGPKGTVEPGGRVETGARSEPLGGSELLVGRRELKEAHFSRRSRISAAFAPLHL